MTWLNDLLLTPARWTRSNLSAITLGIAATILIIFGNDINRMVKRKIRHWPFVFRLLTFILICTFGYAVTTILFGKSLARFLGTLSDGTLLPVVIVIFAVIGLIAEHKGHI